MAFLRRNDNAKPDYTALQLQTSTSILPVPIVWGQNKISVNVLWYTNFQAVPGGSGKGIGGKGGLVGDGNSAGADYTYTADIILGLCEGPIDGIGLIWKDLSIYAPLELGLGTEFGTTPQAVWSYLAEIYPDNALAYQGTAYFWGEGYDLGNSASIGNHNVEILGVLSGSGVNGIDADPAFVIQDFLTNAQYGCGFSPASIDFGIVADQQRFAQGLLLGNGLCLLAGPGQPGTGVEHPRPLVAAFQLRGSLERRSSQIHSIRRHRDFARNCDYLSDAAFDPHADSGVVGGDAAGLCRSRFLDGIRFGWRRGLRLL